MGNLAGKAVGRYHILEQLGEGGMATVYKAYDPRLQTDVALKVIRSEVIAKDSTGRSIKRFEREARALAKLDHPNIVKVTDYGEYEGSPYLVMPLISGGTLKKRLGRPMAWTEAAALLFPIARALAYAHQQGIIHRDVKPSNILITESGDPMLTDFGVAKLLETEETLELTGTGIGVGTPEYMAPEQGMGQRTDHRADIYSLGVIFYEMVTGRKPYRADTPMAVLYKQMTDPLPRPSQFVQDLPHDVERVLFKALTKAPDERFQSMQEFAAAVEALPRPPTKTETPSRNQQARKDYAPARRPAMLTSRFALTFGLVTAVIVLTVGFGPSLLTRSANITATATHIPPLSDSEAPAASTLASSTLPVEITDEYGVSMVLVPVGEFMMGSENGDLDERPAHTVYLDSYYIDKFEVTNALYQECVQVGACEEPRAKSSHFRAGYYGIPEFDDYPVIHLDWNMAQRYCMWRGAELPTEAQWEKAARGVDARAYPWGNEMTSSEANFGTQDTTEAGNYEDGKSAYGVYDMAGNVREWVADWYSAEYYDSSPAENPTGPSTGLERVLRGGSWLSSAESISTFNRDHRDPTQTNNTFGFRCAQSVDGNASGEQTPSPLSINGDLYFVSDRGGRWNLYEIDSLSQEPIAILPANLALEKQDGRYAFISSWSPDREKLLIGQYTSGYMSSVYLFNDGQATLLSDNPEDYWWGAAWSPDSHMILITSKQFTEHTSLTTINTETLERATLTVGEGPTWSPDGTKIAYTSGNYYQDDAQAMVVDIRDSRRVIIADGGWWPQWSPDGKYIAYYKGPTQNRTLHVSSAQGQYVTQIASSVDSNFLWSPDGTQIAYLRKGDLYLSDVAAPGERLLVDRSADPDEYYDAQIIWSPDGQTVAIATKDWLKQGEEWVPERSLDVVDLETWTVVNLGDGENPVFAPDSSALAFVTERDGNLEVYIVNVDGSGIKNVTNNPADDTQPTWLE